MRHAPKSIAFELSNRCNYSHIHSRCPTVAKADPVFLKTRIITDAIDYLGQAGLTPDLFFNIYNEPLLDPRLFWLFQYVCDHSECKITIFTNGWNLNQYMIDEMKKLRVSLIVISAYDDEEENRLREVECWEEGVRVQRITLDPLVMQIYGNPLISEGPCRFPSVYPMVNHLGQMVLCCRDYEWREVIADLNAVSFEEALRSPKRVEICDSLEQGLRRLDICKRCAFVGWDVTIHEWNTWKQEHGKEQS